MRTRTNDSTTSNTTLQPLIEQGTISEAQAQAVQAALVQETSEQQRSRRHLLSEVLSYVGGAVILISGAFIVTQAWDVLGAWGRFALIGVGALILFIAGWVLSRNRDDNTIRRLTGTLFVGSAVLTAVAVGSLLRGLYLPEPFVYSPSIAWREPGLMAIAAATGLVVAVVGYSRTRTIIGQVAIGVAAVATIMGATTAATYYQDQSDFEAPRAGFWLVLVLGIGWIAMSRVGVFTERVIALVVGAAMVLFGAQAAYMYESVDWLSGTVFIALGFGFLALYIWWREWPMLAAGIIAILEGGIQLFVTYFEGIGIAIGTMALGVALLAIGLVAPRLMKSLTPH